MSDESYRFRDYSGGCQCGAVRFHATELRDNPHLCYCRMCQKAFGGFFGALVAAIVAGIVSALTKKLTASTRRRRPSTYSRTRTQRRTTTASRNRTPARRRTANASVEDIFKGILGKLGK